MGVQEQPLEARRFIRHADVQESMQLDQTPIGRRNFRGTTHDVQCDVANAGIIDISKVQNFCFTALVLIGYTVTIFYRLQNHFLVVTNDFPPLGKLDVTAFVQAPEEYWTVLPDLSLTMLTLIGISHVGYLAYKAMPTGGGAPAASGGAPAPGPLG